jgi:predicted RNase H-like HicB family nuclease
MGQAPLEIEVKPWEDGAYLIEIPALQGCWCVIRPRQTVARALQDIRDVVDLAIQARRREGKPVPSGLDSPDASTPLRAKLAL